MRGVIASRQPEPEPSKMAAHHLTTQTASYSCMVSRQPEPEPSKVAAHHLTTQTASHSILQHPTAHSCMVSRQPEPQARYPYPQLMFFNKLAGNFVS